VFYHVLLVAAGGAIGSGLRHLVNVMAGRVLGTAFPWGTFAVNLVGCFLMGVFIEVLARRLGGSQELRLFVATGILGGFTTFSAFSLDFATLYQRGAMFEAFAYVAGSVLLSLAGVFLGLWLAKSIA
jgi:CrcB protein